MGYLPSIDRVITLFPYTATAQHVIGSWKMEGVRGLSIEFSSILARVLAMSIFKEAVLVPVPPRPGKIRKKGWDQIEELSSILANSYGITVQRCLKRTSSIEQKSLGKLERVLNVKGQITVCKESKAPAFAVILDDLMTTGATLDACSAALKYAGSRKVYGLTLFYD